MGRFRLPRAPSSLLSLREFPKQISQNLAHAHQALEQKCAKKGRGADPCQSESDRFRNAF